MRPKGAKQFLKRGLGMALSMAVAFTMLPPVSVNAAEDGSNEDPAVSAASPFKAGSMTGTETTKGQPFVAGVTGGRSNFSTPSMILRKTWNEGTSTDTDTLVAVAEGKYDTTRKAGGVDIVASVSEDEGGTWTYSYPLRFPDSEGNAGVNATTINNPSIVEDHNGKIYLFANANPTGISAVENGFTFPGAGRGYITVGEGESASLRLALTDTFEKAATAPTEDGTTYAYYVGDWNGEGEDALAPVLKRADNSESDYAVDRWYNLYKKNNDSYVAITQKQATEEGITAGTKDVQQNVFYAGSELHVYNTGYIVYMTSEDGKNWSAPEILNPYVKTEDDTAILVSEGSSLVTSAGRIVVPVYRSTDGTDAGKKASIIWRCTEADHPWHRSDDVPNFSDFGAEGAAPSWSGQGEIVEISDGRLRLFFKNGRGLICYADANRGRVEDNPDFFKFSTPVETGVAVTSDAGLSAVEYSKTVNGRHAVLVSAPAGSGLTNGRIYTFLGNDDADKSVTRASFFDIPGAGSIFGNSCMAGLDNGNKIGLLWENGNGTVRYDCFGIADIVGNNAFIPEITIDVDIYKGETWTREYTVTGNEYLTGVTTEPNSSIASYEFDRGTATKETVPALYSHKALGSNQNTLEGAFDSNLPEINLTSGWDISKAEFRIKRPSNAEGFENVYSVYSEGAKQYLTNVSSADALYTATMRNTIKIYHDSRSNGDGTTFNIRAATGSQRFVLFNKSNLAVDAAGDSNDWFGSNENINAEFTFLQKLHAEEMDTVEDQPIPGYKKVEEITSGELYLIACPMTGSGTFENGGWIILYPQNGKAAGTKLVYGNREVERAATKTLTVTAVEEGETSMVANSITYQIHSLGNREISLAEGERRFFGQIDLTDCDLSSGNTVVSLEEGEEYRNALFNCESTSNNNLNGYSTTPNWDINMTAAEFQIQEEGEHYLIHSEVSNNYLVNSNAGTYFGNTPVTQSLTKVEGSDSFEIRRVSNDNFNNRYVYFYYQRMAFDAVSDKAGFEDKGDFGFELLEKQPIKKNTDPIPGYERVGTITPGKAYLITEYYHDAQNDEDVIIVLYPNNGIQNQSKLYRSYPMEGVYLTAIGKVGDTTTVTINGREYDVTIVDCTHPEDQREMVRIKKPTCEEKGYTGDLICSVCGHVITEGEEEADLGGHLWSEWSEPTEATFENDSVRTRSCSRGDKTETEIVKTSAQFVSETLAALIGEAEALNEEDYVAYSFAPLKAALQTAKGLAEDAEKADKIAAIEALQEAMEPGKLITKAEYNEAKGALTDLVTSKEADLAKTDIYTAESLEELRQAINAAKALGEDATLEEINAAKEAIDQVTLVTLESITLEQLKGELATALETAKKTLDAGQKNYTDESWKKFKDAYAAANLSKEDLDKLNLAAVQKLFNDLTAAVKGLTVKPNVAAQLPAGTKRTQGDTTFVVGANKTVVIEKGANVRTVKVPASIKLDNVDYTVVGIGKNAYKGKSKIQKVVISDTVTSIGSQAFANCKKLKSVTIGKGVTTIDGKAFFNCKKLNKVEVKGKSLKAIKKQAFKKTASKVTVKAKSFNKKQRKALLKKMKSAGMSKKSVVK